MGPDGRNSDLAAISMINLDQLGHRDRLLDRDFDDLRVRHVDGVGLVSVVVLDHRLDAGDFLTDPAGDRRCDMHGNVSEWCEDYYGEYAKLPGGKNPTQTAIQSDHDFVVRGGSWLFNSFFCRSAQRDVAPSLRMSNWGFRVVVLP